MKLSAVLALITGFILVCLQGLGAKPGLSEMAGFSAPNSPSLVATAAAAPTFVAAKLGGKPVHVLYITRADDTVLVRCYPGYQPTIVVRDMGSKPGMVTPKEGVMTCKAAT